MKTIVSIVLLATITLFSKEAYSQNTKLSNTLLWEITGKGLNKPSYLFGTIHIICEDDYILREKVTKALAATTQLVGEINTADSNEMKSLMRMSFAEVPLSKKLAPGKYNELRDSLKNIYNWDIKKLDALTIEAIASMLVLTVFDCPKQKLYEFELQRLAQAQNKTFVGLEKVAEQKEIVEKTLGEDYVFTVLKTTKEFNAAFRNLIQSYKIEDVNKLYNAITSDVTMTPERIKRMLTDRNNNWVKKLPAIMKEKSSFIAVGAAHLGGEEGVINLLRKAGYTLTPIMN